MVVVVLVLVLRDNKMVGAVSISRTTSLITRQRRKRSFSEPMTSPDAAIRTLIKLTARRCSMLIFTPIARCFTLHASCFFHRRPAFASFVSDITNNAYPFFAYFRTFSAASGVLHVFVVPPWGTLSRSRAVDRPRGMVLQSGPGRVKTGNTRSATLP